MQERSESMQRTRIARSHRTCRIAAVRAEPGRLTALSQTLSAEFPEFTFSVHDRAGIDSVWLCGFAAGDGEHLAALRRAHPTASLLVTGHEPVEAWRDEAFAAGADAVRAWPMPLGELRIALRSRSRD